MGLNLIPVWKWDGIVRSIFSIPVSSAPIRAGTPNTASAICPVGLLPIPLMVCCAALEYLMLYLPFICTLVGACHTAPQAKSSRGSHRIRSEERRVGKDSRGGGQ